MVTPSFWGPTYICIWTEFDEEALSLKAQLPHFGPVESIDLGEALKKEHQYHELQRLMARARKTEDRKWHLFALLVADLGSIYGTVYNSLLTTRNDP